MGRWRKPFAIITVAVALGGGFYVIGTDGGSQAGTYAVFVSSSGSNSATNCKRYDPAQADPGGQVCLTFGKACSLASAGDNILVRNDGNYAQQSMGDTECPDTAPAVTFIGQSTNAVQTPGAASDAPVVNGACTSNCTWAMALETYNGTGGVWDSAYPSCSNCGSGRHAPSYITFYNLKFNAEVEIAGNQTTTGAGTEGVNVTFDHDTLGSIYPVGVSGFLLDHSMLADCYQDGSHVCIASQSNDWSMPGVGGLRQQSSGTIQNSTFHDYWRTTADHGECWFALDYRIWTIQNNKFYNCTVSGGIRIERKVAPASDALLTIQNNWFGTMWDSATNDTDQRCEAVTWGANDFNPTKVLIRYNTFTAGEGPFGSSGSPDSTFRIIANFVGMDPTSSCEITPANANYASATVNWNVWVANNQGSNSATVASTAAFNALLVNSTGGASGKPDLANTTNPPNNYVTCTTGDMQLTTDFYGTARTNPCDAGAYEH